MRSLFVVLSAVLAMSASAQARVIWADDFNHLSHGPNVKPHNQFHVKSGNDYTLNEVNSGGNMARTSIRNMGYVVESDNRSLALVFSDNQLPIQARATVPMSRFAPFDTSSPGDRLMRIRFDMGFSTFSGNTGLRFVIKPDDSSVSNLIMGFGAADVIPGGGREMFFFAANGGNSDDIVLQKSHALGLNAAGTAFEPGFNFPYSASNEAVNQSISQNADMPSYPNLYRFDVTFDGTTYNGTITRGSFYGEMTEDVAAFSITVPPVTLSSTDSQDRFIIETGSNSNSYAFVDNIEFSVTPEPSSAALLLGLTGLAMRRRHRHATH